MKKLTLRICLLLGMTCPGLSSPLAGPLHEAAAQGDLNEVKRLIAQGAKVKAKDKDGNTPLHKAAINGHTAVASLLIDEGAKVKARNNAGHTPLHAAAYRGERVVAEMLIANGAKVKAKDNAGHTPLHAAAFQGDGAVAELLIARGANVNVADNAGHTPLYWAQSRGHMDIVELLKRHGAKGGEITPEEARLVLYGPGLEDAQVTFKRQASRALGGTVETGHWRAGGRRWPQAWLLFRQLHIGFVFVEAPPLARAIKRSFPNATVVIGEGGKSTNQIGKLEFQRFTRVRAGENIPCVGMRQYAQLGVVDHRAVLSSVDDTLISGWYCAAPLTELTDEVVRRFLQGIGVRGIAVPKKTR